MNTNRRAFLRTGALGAAALATTSVAATSCASTDKAMRQSLSGPLQLRWYPYTLQLKDVFTIATSSRTTTPTMMVELVADGITGYGEASMPPYLGETQATAAAF